MPARFSLARTYSPSAATIGRNSSSVSRSRYEASTFGSPDKSQDSTSSISTGTFDSMCSPSMALNSCTRWSHSRSGKRLRKWTPRPSGSVQPARAIMSALLGSWVGTVSFISSIPILLVRRVSDGALELPVHCDDHQAIIGHRFGALLDHRQRRVLRLGRGRALLAPFERARSAGGGCGPQHRAARLGDEVGLGRCLGERRQECLVGVRSSGCVHQVLSFVAVEGSVVRGKHGAPELQVERRSSVFCHFDPPITLVYVSPIRRRYTPPTCQ